VGRYGTLMSERTNRTVCTSRVARTKTHCFEAFAWKLSAFCSDRELGECGGFVSIVSKVRVVAMVESNL